MEKTDKGKPPAGLTPRDIHLEIVAKQRMMDVIDAIWRYSNAGMKIPNEWFDELRETI